MVQNLFIGHINNQSRYSIPQNTRKNITSWFDEILHHFSSYLISGVKVIWVTWSAHPSKRAESEREYVTHYMLYIRRVSKLIHPISITSNIRPCKIRCTANKTIHNIEYTGRSVKYFKVNMQAHASMYQKNCDALICLMIYSSVTFVKNGTSVTKSLCDI